MPPPPAVTPPHRPALLHLCFHVSEPFLVWTPSGLPRPLGRLRFQAFVCVAARLRAPTRLPPPPSPEADAQLCSGWEFMMFLFSSVFLQMSVRNHAAHTRSSLEDPAVFTVKTQKD